jgi:hypothetical protein
MIKYYSVALKMPSDIYTNILNATFVQRNIRLLFCDQFLLHTVQNEEVQDYDILEIKPKSWFACTFAPLSW